MDDGKSWKLYSFRQATLLATEKDSDLRRGVCASLCVYWLRELQRGDSRPPEQRLQALEMQFSKVRGDQQALARGYAAGRDKGAFQDLARDLTRVGSRSLVFEEHTTVARALLSHAKVVDVLLRDLDRGRGAVWILRWSAGKGHAVAGIEGIEALKGAQHRMFVRLFDPNRGEWELFSWDRGVIAQGIRNMLSAYPAAIEVERLSEG